MVLSFEDYWKQILEKRSNPHLNIKYTNIDIIKQIYERYDIKNNPDTYFISFTQINKIGINPVSEYTTPIGIYTYPFYYVYDLYSKNENLPFAEDFSHYFTVLKLKEEFKKNIIDTKKYGNKDFQKDMRKIISFYDEEWESDIKELIQNSKYESEIVNNYSSQLFYVIENLNYISGLEKKETIFKTQMLMKLGYLGIIDNGLSVIHEVEPHQAVFFKKSCLDIIGTFVNTKREKITTILKIIENGNDYELDEFLRKGNNIEINSKDKQGNSPLHLVCKYEFHIPIIELMIKKGSRIDAKNMDGETPLFVAYLVNNYSIMKLLLKYGANPNIKNNDGKSVIDIATEEEDNKALDIISQFSKK